MEEQLTRLSDRVTWLEAKLLEEREANDELTRHLIDLREKAEQEPEPVGPSAPELLAALQQVLDATATASTKAAAAMDERVELLVAQRIDAVRAELDQRTGIPSIESERRIREVDARAAALASEVEGVRMRVAELSEALTRQFDELGHELDGLGERTKQHDERLAEVAAAADSAAVQAASASAAAEAASATAAAAGRARADAIDAATLDAKAEELRANQARIANELVRFEVALRQEVAHLAEKVQQQSRRR